MGQCLLQGWAERVGRQYIATQDWPQAQLTVLPQPISPFFWKLVIRAPTGYDLAFVNLLAVDPVGPVSGRWRQFVAAYRPIDALKWQQYATVDSDKASAVWRAPQLALYRRFARLPYLVAVTEDPAERCYWFGDLRFVLPELATPFRYGLCQRAGTEHFALYRLTGRGITERQAISQSPW